MKENNNEIDVVKGDIIKFHEDVRDHVLRSMSDNEINHLLYRNSKSLANSSEDSRFMSKLLCRSVVMDETDDYAACDVDDTLDKVEENILMYENIVNDISDVIRTLRVTSHLLRKILEEHFDEEDLRAPFSG